MCTIVFIDGNDISNVGELKAAIGPEHVVCDEEEEYGDDVCLCVVDIHESAKRAGYECRNFYMDFEFVKIK